jgi:hypothetical protein
MKLRWAAFTGCFLLLLLQANAQQQAAFFTQQEVAAVKKQKEVLPLLKASFAEAKQQVDGWLTKDVDVPVPKDAAGGYTHERHKSNYILCFNSGILYQLTGNKAYADLVKKILLKYAALNPGLPKHPQAKSSSPGHLFHQALNDANWLVYMSLAYDCIYKSVPAAERKQIEEGAFQPEIYFMTHDLESWFNLVHNHGTWACAGVGIAGLAMHNEEYVQMALYGTHKDGKGGFMAQLDQLFSPDGYYTEGPYYVRYAILPFYVFANALNNNKPGLQIFEYRNRILGKALNACLQQTNTDGTFFPVNDAIKEKDFTTNELVTAIDIAWKVYGANDGWLSVAAKQQKVLLNGGGAAIAARLASGQPVPAYYPYSSVEYTDGAKGDGGGTSLLRSGKGDSLTTLLFKYTSHGLSHGHYDKLHLSLYNKGNEVFTDYGAVRFVNVEQKYGGRYLPESEAYAAQTIAHNTMVVDEKSHYNGKEAVSEQYHPVKAFSAIGKSPVQVVSAVDSTAATGVRLQRTLYLLQLPGEKEPLIADLFQVKATAAHQYDLPFHYDGQLMHTSFPYTAFTSTQSVLGAANGYQFLWKEAAASGINTPAQFTFLNHRTYYTLSSVVDAKDSIFFTRTGANDPDFNMRHEPAYILRKKGKDVAFCNVIEVHGEYDAVGERSVEAGSKVQQLQLLQNDKDYTIIAIQMKNNRRLLVAQCNTPEQVNTAAHELRADGTTLTWKGNFAVWLNGSMLAGN